ncbi:hypothetical protein QF027_000215 [Streptomyces canus]|nr:hypothetical protein [Streptomyces canus]
MSVARAGGGVWQAGEEPQREEADADEAQQGAVRH